MKRFRSILLVLLAGLLAVPAMAEAPRRVSNRIKYRDTSVKPATGRSGSAWISAQALMAADHGTVIEISSGKIGESNPSGTIEKIQLKVSKGPATRTENFVNLTPGSTVVLEFDDLAYLDALHIQANVKGIDPKRTDVVTLSQPALVQLRPDVAVTGFLVPQVGEPNLPVSVKATISELNGDVGARVDAILTADGVQVDRALGLWVNENGTVECFMSYTPATPGIKELRVSLVNVNPSDYNLSNNSATAQIEVTQSGEFLQYDAMASDIGFEGFDFYSDPFTDVLTTREGWDQQAGFNGISAELSFETATVQVKQFTGTTPLFDQTFALGAPGANGCVDRTDSSRENRLRVCRNALQRTSYSLFRQSGAVAYLSETWWKDPFTGEVYFYEVISGGSNIGNQIRLENTYEFEVTVTDGAHLYEANPTISLAPVSWVEDEPLTCTVYGFFNFFCTQSHFEFSGIRGSVSQTN